jgi:RES domain-containing protein
MIVLWRLYRARYGPGLDGAGGTFADGRWHTRGTSVVYFGSSAAIMVLERLAHTDPDYSHGICAWPVSPFAAGPPYAESKTLRSCFSTGPRIKAPTRLIGGKWLRDGGSCLLVVSSAILPEESNFVFNPGYRNSKPPQMISERPFTFYARLI